MNGEELTTAPDQIRALDDTTPGDGIQREPPVLLLDSLPIVRSAGVEGIERLSRGFDGSGEAR